MLPQPVPASELHSIVCILLFLGLKRKKLKKKLCACVKERAREHENLEMFYWEGGLEPMYLQIYPSETKILHRP